ncbi:MAG: hypothetical protein ACREKN_08535 [Longimicrobiaceae bacterium]
MTPPRATALLLAAALLMTGCGVESDPAAEGPADERFQGSSREELMERGEPLSPQEALERGVIDTTIHVEPMEDTFPRPDTVPGGEESELPGPS